MLLPPSPAFSRARAESFSIRPALAVLQNTFGGRKRATSVSENASQHSKTRSPVFPRFPGLDPRPRTTSTATVMPPSAKSHSLLTMPVIDSMSRAPRIPSFYDMGAESFSHDLGLTLGLNPRLSTASTSTIRAQEESANNLLVHGNHACVDPDRETLPSLADSQALLLDDPEGGSTNARSGSISSSTRVGDGLTHLMEQPIISAPRVGAGTSGNIDGRSLDTDIERHPEPLSLDLSSLTQPSMQSASTLHGAHADPSHAAQGENLYLEGTSTTGVTIPSPAASSISSAVVSPTGTAGVVSPTHSVVSLVRDHSFVTVSSARSAVALTSCYVNISAPYSSPNSISPSPPTMISVPFPASEDNDYTSDDGSASRYPIPSSRRRYISEFERYSYRNKRAASSTKTWTGNWFAGVGTYASGKTFRPAYFRLVITMELGVSGVDREKDYPSVASGIRARVTSLRAPQALAALIPAFMKRARRKSSRMRDDGVAPRLRGRTASNAKEAEGWVEGAERPGRVGSSCALTESSSIHSPYLASGDEHNISPSSSHLDLLSPDPFASTMALKVGAWSEMYAGRTDSVISSSLPPLLNSVDDRLNVQSEYSGSIYGDDDSEEESSIRIYSHSRGRSLSQPDVYTIPIEPLHQAAPTRRIGRSLDRRRGPGNRRGATLPARPSLPSLSTLTRKNVIVPIPRSAAAARFPSEPWDDIPSRTLYSPATRGLGSLIIPSRPSHSPVRGSPFPRSPMRSLVRMASESSIAEDEDEDEGDEDENENEEDEDENEDVDEGEESAGRVLSGSEDQKVWWSSPPSRVGSSRKSSFVGSYDDPTISLTAPTDPIVRASVASTIQPRESIVSQVSEGLSASVRDSMVSSTSHEEIDVSSESFLQTLNELDTAVTPPPSSRTSSDRSMDTTSSEPMLNEAPAGVGPRNQMGSDGIQGGAEGDYQKQGVSYEWQSGQSKVNFGGNEGDGHCQQAPEDSDSSETGSESESESGQRPWRGRDTHPGPSFPTHSRSQFMPRPPSSNSRTMNREIATPYDSSDDEIPLAQRLPTALKAQKSIRLQDKADREERRQRRLERMNKRAAERATATGGEGGVVAGELAKRLLNVQVGGEHSRDRVPLPSPRSPRQMQSETNLGPGSLLPAPGVRSRTTSNVSYVSRSRTHTRNGSMEQQAPLNPLLAPLPCHAPRRCPTAAPPPPISHHLCQPPRPLFRAAALCPGLEVHKTIPVTMEPRACHVTALCLGTVCPSPMPPMPPVETLPVPGRRPSQPEPYVPPVVEQRIYIGDRQRFIVVDIGAPNTTAADVLDMARQRGELDIDETGSWQLWEQSNECGMERPVRDFELITDVLKAWNPEKRVNVLIIRFSSFCSLLKPENIPSSSPLMAGWVMWISRPGKWSKRWLELREHGLFACKNEKGKDRTHLCSLSHFDGYIVTHVPRAPKPYVFAVKSIDISGVFEKEEDSSHIFSCDKNSGELWLARILLARSYILQQERTVLFRPVNAGTTLTSSKSMLSRSGTKKNNVSSRAAGPQYPPPLVQDSTPSPFAQGSLLAKAAANGV
ncbi:Pleckstrin homology domain [Rhizoctonia solani]|uniref:Pleckstrin homology domain n=1 Tax=Rhizoctonia solani TaxID=456999 RepID=A0A8H7IDS5_9AGAM|nr:Pleckstrin homology domain [Rhizoctonia solani]